jgi:hypothetical protein
MLLAHPQVDDGLSDRQRPALNFRPRLTGDSDPMTTPFKRRRDVDDVFFDPPPDRHPGPDL